MIFGSNPNDLIWIVLGVLAYAIIRKAIVYAFKGKKPLRTANRETQQSEAPAPSTGPLPECRVCGRKIGDDHKAKCCHQGVVRVEDSALV
jgi:hypothetical protein